MPEDSPPPVANQAGHAIPVGLNEAALDSPTFRVTAANFGDQVDAIEKWLNGYAQSTSKLLHDILALEETINTFLIKTMPSAADGVVDNDYTFLALKRVGDGWREYWIQMISTMKKMDGLVVDPIRQFVVGDLRNFKECRRAMEQAQRTFDSTLARYVSQSKTKEPSALREDAFAVFETRKAYLKASMDYCQLAPQLRFSMDKLLVKICNERWSQLRRAKEAAIDTPRWNQEMERIQGWSNEMGASEMVFRRELQSARREIGENALAGFKPSRELEDYSTSTVPFLGTRGPITVRLEEGATVVSEKQGWLFLRVLSGKPARHTWIRRWYYCRDGIFGWLIPGPLGVLQGDEIGVLLCNAKPAVAEDRRFCFEVKTKSQTILLQAETQGELTEWLEVFEVTKKRAFETSMNRTSASLPGSVDPAFSISPPSIPEFSAKALDAQIGIYDESSPSIDRTNTLPVPGPDGNLSTRPSFDVNGSLSRRTITALGRDLAREEGESGREHAARIIQKLDLHRKATFGTQGPDGGQGGSASTTGLASMMATSHTLPPGFPGSVGVGSSSNFRQTPSMLPSVDTQVGSLAPATLAKPPSMTGLSRIAVLTAGERQPVGNNRKLPASVVANYWGTSLWGAMNTPPQPVLPRLDEDDPIGVVVPGSTVGQGVQRKDGGEYFPRNYPPELRAQHAQFRLLFPDAPLEEKLVLVFRAAWTGSPERGPGKPDMAGDGRIYVTPDNMYFYGQQIGLVTAYSISLDIISEVTAAPGRDCDFIFLHLNENANETGYTRITIKVFLEDLGLLHTRLNLLIDDIQAEEPMDVEAIITTLVNLEKEEFDRPSPSVESWEEVSANTPMDDGTSMGRPVARRMEFSPPLRPSKSRARHNHKLHLPARPVIYEPEGMKEMAAERHFEISAKSCFHVLFGDKSFVFPKLYFERRAQQIAQGPWVLVDQGRMRRDFQFKVDYKDVLGRSKTADVNDYQIIDVFSDHVTYVVTHVKTAWHLPHSNWFKVVNKIVITHVAKSKCKLSIYTKTDWSKSPALSKNLIDRQAIHDAASDAEELAEVATDQVRKLGTRSRTTRAIQVYGQIGQQTEVVVFSPAATESTKKQAIKPRTLTTMVFETIRSLGESAVSSLIMWAIAALRNLFNLITAQWVIIALLAFSTLTNVLLTSSETSTWWKERRAAGFMQNIGIRPNSMMSKAIYFADLDAASGTNQAVSFPDNSTCFSTFKHLLDTTDMDTPWEDAGASLTTPTSRATARRLRRTRQRLGSYRHDLLVAMRVVNSIEREMLQSEWENWLVDEKFLCDELDTMLQQQDGIKGQMKGTEAGKRSQKVMEPISTKRRQALEQWRDSYCGSCKKDYQVVMKELAYTMATCATYLPMYVGTHHIHKLHRQRPNMGGTHHEPLGAMGPIEWEQVPQDDLNEFLADVLSETQTVVESIPMPSKREASYSTGRARSKTESAASAPDIKRALTLRQKAEAIGQAQDLQKEWKEVKVNAKENPLGINVYKLSAKDGRGAWFARRSVHEGISFDNWKKGLSLEFSETMKVQGAPGSGNIRGIGADKRVEDTQIVFQLSAQFPGPTAPRDFVTLLLTSETSVKLGQGSRPLRQYMIVSKPCEHPECPPRQGIIRGYYESVEVIREVPVDNFASKRSLSSADLLDRDEGRIASPKPGSEGHGSIPLDEPPTAVEWLMVTRSDPGGSVPRFLIEKGTPPGIVGDAGKFLKWVTAKAMHGFAEPEQTAETNETTKGTEADRANLSAGPVPTTNIEATKVEPVAIPPGQDDPFLGSNGLYGVITSAIGTASSYIPSGLLKTWGTGSDIASTDENLSNVPAIAEEQHEEESDTSSIRSFASALERSVTAENKSPDSLVESQSETSRSNQQQSQQSLADKELKKLEHKKKKLDEKMARLEERRQSKILGDKEKDAATLAKMREKHEKEVAKQEEKYRREMRKLEEKRERDQRKAEERRRKAAEQEEKNNLSLELERVRAERDVARRQIELLEGQVGELQAQNTMLVRKLGKNGLLDSPGSPSPSIKSIQRAHTEV
ncbi:putative Snf1p protein kinase interacting protein (SIP3 protein) [Fusarium austroafricanum]|uniref:Putative Snf1p protein kinase interacting protein (SIP3 protein) n=1 Tax=Fusarium austroafricanum TaxID=2364996 RepID=A0A8H4KL34_9HYPO|nr:putative Snf1p protein kinase interacting protein (SIP3 protein) [Fusarium austroafricanum]